MDFTGENDLERALKLLAGHLRLAKTPPVNLVVCGGAALLARRLHLRTTQDVDVLALLDSEAHLHSPLPLPGYLLEAAHDVADTLGLPGDWLNNAPSADAAGLYQSGLPEGLLQRALRRDYGDRLTVWYVGRFDQIHFKLLAAVNAGGRHLEDLRMLGPTAAELAAAAAWMVRRGMTEQQAGALRALLGYLGHGQTASGIEEGTA